jgi:hypothetical protein
MKTHNEAHQTLCERERKRSGGVGMQCKGEHVPLCTHAWYYHTEINPDLYF